MEEQIAKDIWKVLSDNGGEFVEIPLTPFIQAWANGKPSISDAEISKGLLQFAKKYSMDYLWVLVDGMPMHNTLRFWKKAEQLPEPDVTIIGEEPKEN